LPLLSAILVSSLGVLILFRGKRERTNITFVFFSVAITVWLFGTFMMFLNKESAELVLFWDRFVYVGVVFIPAISYHFGLALIRDYSLWRRRLMYLGYFFSLVFLAAIPSAYFLNGVFNYQWGIHARAQILHSFFLVYFAFYIVYWFVAVYKYYQSVVSAFEREKIKYSFIAFLVFASVGTFGFLPAYGYAIYPVAYISGVLFSVILAYAIIVHRLMDIKLVMRRSSVYLITLASILAPAYFIKEMLMAAIGRDSVLADIIIFVLALGVFTPLKNYFYRAANRYFFSSLYDAREVIAELSDKLSSTLEADKIFGYLSKALSAAFHYKAMGIFSLEEWTGDYRLKYNDGFALEKHKRIKGAGGFFAGYAGRSKIVFWEELKNSAYGRHKEFIDEFVYLKAEIIAPLNLKDETIGFIVLGRKESGDMYNDEDVDVLKIIGAQAAIALENALLYEETRNFNRKLKREVAVATADLRAANEKLKKLDAAKSEFISIASHQLRTPLTAIKGYISMVIDGDFGTVSETARQSLEKIFESNERLIRLVENLLNISRIESGRLQFNYGQVQMEKMIESVVYELGPAAKKKDLNLVYNRPKKLTPKVKIDEEKIRQVVMNLTDNAIKYTNAGEVVLGLEYVPPEKAWLKPISVANAGMPGRYENGFIEYSVTDSGMGVSQNDLPNLFQKFSRGTGTSLVHTEGTGLGLYVARQMVEMHHGQIWAESLGESQGSKFAFRLPVYLTTD